MKALHHVGITVKDLDASIRFYHDVLGLPFSNEPSPWFDGPELGPVEPRARLVRELEAQDVVVEADRGVEVLDRDPDVMQALHRSSLSHQTSTCPPSTMYIWPVM